MPIPNCPTGCLNPVPIPSFDECNPEINAGEIAYIYMTQVDAPLDDWSDLSEWESRLVTYDGSVSSYADNSIIKLTVIGDKPEPTRNEIEVSGDRKVSVNNEHIINFRIDETNAVNHEWMREMECNGGGRRKIWYETSGGLLFGGGEDGNDGINANVKVAMVIPEGRNDIITITGTADWKSTFTESRITSPMA